jgi:orotate phosphoribosyltransferase
MSQISSRGHRVSMAHTGPAPVLGPSAFGMMTAVTSQEDLTDELTDLARDIDATCRLTGEFTLRSGQVASEYFDKYLFEAQPALLARVVEQMARLVPERTEMLGGLELGGVPIATILSARTGLPGLFVRKKAKNYGTCKLAEGGDVSGRRVTLVEDVITTGGAVRDATNALRAEGAIVETVICAIDRSPEGSSPLADVGLEVRAVLTKALLDAVHL